MIFFNIFTSQYLFFLHPCCRKSKNWKKFRIFWPKLSQDEGLMLLYINVKYQNASLHRKSSPSVQTKKKSISVRRIHILCKSTCDNALAYRFFVNLVPLFWGFYYTIPSRHKWRVWFHEMSPVASKLLTLEHPCI